MQSILLKDKMEIEDIVKLLSVDVYSNEFYQLLRLSNQQSRKKFGDKGYVFLQMGINAEPCTGNCKFCSLAASNYSVEEEFSLSISQIVENVKNQDLTHVSALFLMTTHDYSHEQYLEVGKAVKVILPSHVKLVANIGDFDYSYALELKKVGFSAVYHIVRLGEGVDTDLQVADRERSITALKQAGLELFYCIEPIGREHTYEQIATEINRAIMLDVDVMAVMPRIPVKGTAFENIERITDLEIAKIVAVANLAVKPKLSMNIHEPNPVAMLAGVNQLYAEMGNNPRDTHKCTENNRGYSVNGVIKMLDDHGYQV